MKTKNFFKLSLVFLFGMTFLSYSQESNDYEMYQLIYMQAKIGHESDFSSAVKNHHEKFHNEAPNTASLNLILSGKHAGWYIGVMGPCTFTDLDKIPKNEVHDNDWKEAVAPHIAKYGATEFWQYNPNLSYQIVPNEEVKYMTVFFLDKKRGTKNEDVVALFKNLKAASEKKGVDFKEYFSRFGSNNGRRGMAIVIGHKNMAELDINKYIRKEYIELFGEGSWEKALEQWNEYFPGVNIELWKTSAY